MFKQVYASMISGVPKDKKDWTVEIWAKHSNITEEDLLLYENARVATSPLMQAMEEGTV